MSTEVRSPTSTRTEVRSPTSTRTDAYTQGNFTATVTGGAGPGATNVNIYPGQSRPPAPREKSSNADPQEAWRALFQSSDTGAVDDGLGKLVPLLAIGGVGALLLWSFAKDERKRRRVRA